MIVSYFTGMNDPSEMDPDLFSPVIQRFLNTKTKGKLAQKEVSLFVQDFYDKNIFF